MRREMCFEFLKLFTVDGNSIVLPTPPHIYLLHCCPLLNKIWTPLSAKQTIALAEASRYI